MLKQMGLGPCYGNVQCFFCIGEQPHALNLLSLQYTGKMENTVCKPDT